MGEKDASSSESMSADKPPPVDESTVRTVKAPVLDDQNQRLPFTQLAIAYLYLAVCLFVSFLDVNSTTTALPAIGKSLDTQNSITLAGTSSHCPDCIPTVLRQFV